MLSEIFVEPFVDMVSAPDFLMQVLWEGLVSGILYALIALGFVLIYKATETVSFAQGDLMMLGDFSLRFAAALVKWIISGGNSNP